MDLVVPVLEGSVTCPCGCGHTFPVKQHQSEGAHYSKNQKHFNVKQALIVSYIQSSAKYRESWFIVDDLYSDYSFDFKFTKDKIMKKSTFQGRISELKGMKVLDFQDSTPEKYKINDEIVRRFS